MASGRKEYQEVYSNERIIAIMDHRPVSVGHVLIFPREHYKDIYDIPNDILKEIFEEVKVISTAIKKAYNPPGLNIIQNNGYYAGQTVDHFHVHIIPRYDKSYLWYLIEVAKKRKIESSNILENEAIKIRNFL